MGCYALNQLRKRLAEQRCIVGAVNHPEWGLVILASNVTRPQATARTIATVYHQSSRIRVRAQIDGLRALTRMLDEQEAET